MGNKSSRNSSASSFKDKKSKRSSLVLEKKASTSTDENINPRYTSTDVIFKSPLPDIKIPEVDLYTFLFGREDSPDILNKTVFIDAATDRRLTHGQLLDQVNNLSIGLHDYGIHRKDVVAIIAPNNIEYLIVFLACARIGVTVMTMNPTFTETDMVFQLRGASASYVVTTAALLPQVQSFKINLKIKSVFVFGDEPIDDVSNIKSLYKSGEHGLLPVVPPSSNAVLCFSSGTTGLPKVSQITHTNLIANVLQLVATGTSFTHQDVLFATQPLFHIYGLTVTGLIGIHLRNTTIYSETFSIQFYLSAIEKYHINAAHLSPPTILLLTKLDEVSKYEINFRMIMSGAAPLSANIEDAARKRFPNTTIRQGYGLTELSPCATCCADKYSRSGSVGVLLPNCTAKVIHPVTGKQLGINEHGEICIAGPNVFKGYLNNPFSTSDVIDDEGFFRTGDLGCVDEDGYWYVIDRIRELIRYNDKYIAPAELEGVLLSNDMVTDAAVISQADEQFGQVPKAFVVLKSGVEGNEDTRQNLLSFVESSVDSYKTLRGGIVFVEQIPKSPAGKLLRRLLKEKNDAEIAATAKPATEA